MLSCKFKKDLSGFSLDIDFSLDKEVLALLGASGNGKTLTLKAIAGIITPDEGEIILNDRVLFDSKKGINLPVQERRVGYLFQDYALFPNFTVAENIKVGLKGDLSIDKLMDEMHISHLKDKYRANLSGGEKQRVALARILANKPEIILLDEPFASLDSYLSLSIEEEVKAAISAHMRESIIVTHDKNEAYRFADSVLTIDQGKTYPKEPVAEYFSQPKNIASAKLIGFTNFSRVSYKDGLIKAFDWGIAIKNPRPSEPKYITIDADKIFLTNTKQPVNSYKIEAYKLIEDIDKLTLIVNKDYEKYNDLRINIPKTKRFMLNDDLYFNIKPEDLIFLDR